MADPSQDGRDRKTRPALISGFGVILALMAGLVYFSVDRLDAMHTELLSLDRVTLEKTRAVQAMREAIRKRSFSLVLVSTLHDFFERDQERLNFNQYERDYILARERLVSLGLSTEERSQFESMQTRLRQARTPVNDAMDGAVTRDPDDPAWPRIEDAVTAQHGMIGELDKLVALISNHAKDKTESTLRAYQRTRAGTLALGAVILVSGLFIAVFVIARERRRTRAMVDEIAYRQQAEESARGTSDLLERKVAERTAELSSAIEALRAARDQAEAANLTKSQFLATMSHELRTPLNAIIGFSDAIAQEVFGPLENARYASYVGDILQSGRHLLALINDILDISVIESGKLELIVDRIDASNLAHASTRLVEPAADKGGINLNLHIAEPVPDMVADGRRAQQVLVNLLSNAVKFTPRGGAVTLNVAHADGKVHFTVRDSGIGMTPAEIETALTQFGQVDSDLSRKYEGTGLGLPLARELTVAQNGTFALESQPSVGTTVSVAFPAAVEPSARSVRRA